jgi:hypothetical protein
MHVGRAGCATETLKGRHAPDGSLTPRDLVGKLDVLAIACEKCGRSRRYRVTALAETIGWDGKLTDWLYGLKQDCPRNIAASYSDQCGARCPDLPNVL